ncbi:MAG: bifunctional (p)ppGpp synthetase/guanosine-3',5'-bis(diphosphate) 3'-pyrophosphohydrolase [Bacteroidales bacterium]|nr:bifunctional (p)ppGpp synthetase/guanosine-3',5'-bis(diphosphate) 3'-pyrophosphohydrolase [Bacteroidales bacterium]
MYTPDPEIEKKEILKRYRNLLRALHVHKTPKSRQLIRKAFNMAVEAHKDMRRKTGEPYIYHPLDVARIAAGEIGLGITSIICALLHDVVEDTDYTLSDIKNSFGEEAAKIIDGLTKIKEISDYSTPSMQAENFKKMLQTMSEDTRVILIKLADRLHNMRTSDIMSKEKQLKIASETLYLYAPLANRLGLDAIKSELEDLSLKYTEPDIYSTISKKIKKTSKQRTRFINKFTYPLKIDFIKQGIKYRIEPHYSSIYSIWEKMKKKEILFEEIFNIFAVRIIIDTPIESEKNDCWKVYSIVSDHYRPNPQKLRDWISIPQANGYEALHTTVMSQTGKWVEVQIMTTRMNEIAERGYAAHWKFKSYQNRESGLDEWMKNITELLKSNEENALDFLSDFKMNLFSDEIYIFTPRGELKSLPNGSTALDFAYSIHTQIGNNSIAAKVNHKLVPLHHKLKNSDQVEIITSKTQVPKEKWFSFVVTARAKSRIKAAIKKNRKTFKKEGEKKLEKIFNQLNIEFTKHNISKLQENINLPSSIDLFYFIAKGNIGYKEVKNSLQNPELSSWLQYIKLPFTKPKIQKAESLSETIMEKIKNKPKSILLEGNISKLDYIVSSCCNPIPGDDIIGLISLNEPIQIHRTNCPKAIQFMSRYANQIIKAKWRKKDKIAFLAGIKIKAIDSIGFINKITNIVSFQLKLNIRSLHVESSEDYIEATLMIYVHDTQNLNELINKLKEIKQIKKIIRLSRVSESPI